MRLAFLCHASLGGSARVAIELARVLARQGHEVTLFSRRPPALLNAAAEGFRLECLHSQEQPEVDPGFLDVYWSESELATFSDWLSEALRAVPVDLFHFHYAQPFADLARRLKRSLGRAAPKIVATLHGTDVLRCEPGCGKSKALARILKRDVDAITTVSTSLASIAQERLVGIGELKVIPNFIARARIASPAKRAPGPKVIAHVSNFRAVKRPVAVARIFSQLAKLSDARLRLIGTGPLLSETITALEAEGLSGRVEVLGMRHDVSALLATADVLLLASEYESFSLTALEALAAGTPVVAPRVGGIPEVVDDGACGLLYEPGDEDAGAAALLGLVSDEARLAAYAEQAIGQARRFEAGVIVPRYLEVYRSVLRRPRPSQRVESLTQ